MPCRSEAMKHSCTWNVSEYLQTHWLKVRHSLGLSSNIAILFDFQLETYTVYKIVNIKYKNKYSIITMRK